MKSLIKKFIPSFLLGWYHWSLAFLGACLYRFPSSKLKVIGVTGTNGKTTVVSFITQILEEAGLKVASLSGIKFKIGEKEWPNQLKMTMPGRFKIQKFFRQAVNAKCQYAVLEVTSEGIKQHRHRFISFNTAVFTNLSLEHIEAHGGYENYRKAKGKLFRATKGIHILNFDDKESFWILKNFPAWETIGYSCPDFSSFAPITATHHLQIVFAKNIRHSGKITQFSVERTKYNPNPPDNFTVYNFPFENAEFSLNLMGDFNVYNALAAICTGLSQGISLDTCKRALEKVKGIPGRMEEVISQPFKVVVDYAFTPNALEKVYQTLKPSGAKMICVLGACGGGRDKWKRPVLGQIAAKYCDKVIVTNEDPYDEDPMAIIDEVAAGAGHIAQKILDRREAIRKSLVSAKSNDTVVITGKGCEPWIVEANGKKTPWDDRKVVKEEFQGLNKV